MNQPPLLHPRPEHRHPQHPDANKNNNAYTFYQNSNKNNNGHCLQTKGRSFIEDAKMMWNTASVPIKTPVMILEELSILHGSKPKYNLLPSIDTIFRYRVTIDNDFVATGTGYSKKNAKHEAARNLLDVLIGKQSVEQANTTNGTLPTNIGPSQSVKPNDEDKAMSNPVGLLQEMCTSRHWPPPSYDMEYVGGPSDRRQFRIACRVLEFREIGTGISKKSAKHLSAYKMWQRLQNWQMETNNWAPGSENASENSDEFAAKLSTVVSLQSPHSSMKDIKIPTIDPQHSQMVSQIHESSGPGSKLNELQNIDLKKFNLVQFLHEVAKEQQLEVTCIEKSKSGHHQFLVQVPDKMPSFQE